MNNFKNGGLASLIRTINAPLGFFALALLIVEGFLSTVLIFSDLELTDKFSGMLIGVGLFILVLSCVFLLVWFKPTNLTYGEHSHLESEKLKNNWGTSENPHRLKENEF